MNERIREYISRTGYWFASNSEFLAMAELEVKKGNLMRAEDIHKNLRYFYVIPVKYWKDLPVSLKKKTMGMI